MRAGWRVCLLLALLGSIAAPGRAQTSVFAIGVGPPERGWPVEIHLGDILADEALINALDSALPLRFHLRVELWRNAFLDRLDSYDEASVAVLHDPLSGKYSVETGSAEIRVDSIADAQTALEILLDSDLRPRRRGRHYYLATLEVETLSLSDLDELRRWLRGDVGPALEGRSSPTRAVERGLRRIMVRVIGLPTRRFEARTGTFTVE